MSTEQNLPRVVIAGGGFGGLNAARALKHAPVEIVLIDRATQRGARVIYDAQLPESTGVDSSPE